jgi:hypothetical protein
MYNRKGLKLFGSGYTLEESIVNTQVINIQKFRVQNENKKSSRQIIRHGCTLVHVCYIKKVQESS